MNNPLELSVKIHKISDTKKVNATFSKREFIVETDSQYKQYLLLQVTKDKCEVLNKFKKGDSVKVSINLNGRLWVNTQDEEVCFNTLDCWKIEAEVFQTQPSAINQPFPTTPAKDLSNEPVDDLPF